jgi:shikimate 5-dehydrogenase
MKDAGGKLLLGLIGAGIQRSLTPAMQEEEARQHGLRLHYQLIDLDQTQFNNCQPCFPRHASWVLLD